MEKFVYSSPELEAEREKFRQDIELLESTEGYPLLTLKQRQIIKVSLYLQDRAERAMHPLHINDPYYHDWNRAKTEPYKLSLDHINNWYCHTAVDGLEHKKISGARPQVCAKKFFDGKYFLVDDPLTLKEKIEAFGFPCVVHVGGENGNKNGEDGRLHTFLALGHDSEGGIVVWEKVKIRQPYRVTGLEQVYGNYGHGLFWGIRKLR